MSTRAAALLAALALSLPLSADRGPAEPHDAVRLSARVYVRARVAGATLGRSLAVAGEVLQAAGVRTAWTICRMDEPSAVCDSALQPREITVQLLPLPQREDAALGMAILGTDGRQGRRTRVFCAGVAAVAKANRVPEARVLGHVVAHEIGHLLLGRGGHARQGLMRGDWRASDVRAMQTRGLRFDREQERRIRRRARGKPALRAASHQRAAGSLDDPPDGAGE